MAEIKTRLDVLGVPYDDCLDKVCHVYVYVGRWVEGMAWRVLGEGVE